MCARHQIIAKQDWAAVEEQYNSTTPFNYAVIDGFLPDEVCRSVRDQLINEWGWQYKNWQARELYVRNPEIPQIEQIAVELKGSLPGLLRDLEFVRCWAFMHQQNAGLKVHSDNGAITLDLWLTPNECNLDPATGGLVFYDVKRAPEMMIHEFNTVEWAERYFKQQTGGRSSVVGYAFNRAVLFDARTFHASDSINFDRLGAETYRINLSLLFDDPVEFQRRRAAYEDEADIGIN